MLNLKFGFKISYEEIFEDKIGQKLISDYVGFTPITNLDFKLKMRTNDNQSQINSYEREVKRLLIKNEELKTTLEKYEELKTLVDLMRKTSNKLL